MRNLFVNLQEVKQHIIAMNDDINKVKDLLVKLMKVWIIPTAYLFHWPH